MASSFICPTCSKVTVDLKTTNKDLKLLLTIMNKHNLTVPQLSVIMGAAKRTVYRWFEKSNISKFKIKQVYMDKLKYEGYL